MKIKIIRNACCYIIIINTRIIYRPKRREYVYHTYTYVYVYICIRRVIEHARFSTLSTIRENQALIGTCADQQCNRFSYWVGDLIDSIAYMPITALTNTITSRRQLMFDQSTSF